MIPVTDPRVTRKTWCNTFSASPTLRNLFVRTSEFLKESGVESHHLDARLIVAHALGLEPIDIYQRPDVPIDTERVSAVASLIGRRASGIPTAYIIGNKEFWSLSLTVDERVLIPRPETEFLVEESLAAARSLPEDLTVLELGTGSGAVSIAIGMELAGARIVSTDISPEALSVAETNVSVHGMQYRIVLKQGDLFKAVNSDDRFDLIVSNPPYLTDEEMGGLSPEVRAEPDGALRGGLDGLAVIERIVGAAPDYLNAGGFLIFEVGSRQHNSVRQLIEKTDALSFSRTRSDYAGHPRVIIAQRTNT